MKNEELSKLIKDEITELKRLSLEQRNIIEKLTIDGEKQLDDLFNELLSVLDSFDKADKRIKDQYPEDETALRARKRFATANKRLQEVLRKHGVEEMTFEDGIATLSDCQIVETVPDLSKEENSIVHIEKPGFRRNGRLLRLAEVIVVKN